eukprot:scaffold85039_cov21-Tisochrysis_lutea.AAC.1
MVKAGSINMLTAMWPLLHFLRHLYSKIGLLNLLLECFQQVEAGSIDFLAAIEPRLLLMSVPPAGDAAQPLTLAGLFELER